MSTTRRPGWEGPFPAEHPKGREEEDTERLERLGHTHCGVYRVIHLGAALRLRVYHGNSGVKGGSPLMRLCRMFYCWTGCFFLLVLNIWLDGSERAVDCPETVLLRTHVSILYHKTQTSLFHCPYSKYRGNTHTHTQPQREENSHPPPRPDRNYAATSSPFRRHSQYPTRMRSHFSPNRLRLRSALSLSPFSA